MARSRTARARCGIDTFFKTSRHSGITKTKNSIYPPTNTKKSNTLSSKLSKTLDLQPTIFPKLSDAASTSVNVNAEYAPSRSSISALANTAVARVSETPAQSVSSEQAETSLPNTNSSQVPLILIDTSSNPTINLTRPFEEMTNTETREVTMELYKHFDYAYHEVREALATVRDADRRVVTNADLVSVREAHRARAIIRAMEEAISEAQDMMDEETMRLQCIGH